ncbi:hypothetical protein RINTHM_4810 [Richelia intracellularis HM01]|uniref:hypothetical protein n=1 Tax=Richelia intracellularis TaxID=1164990 RepID=UPI0002B4ED1F|nr:hypothetical protein [Richelia intracellularis]CCH64949.1 hypothetical protein RINTHM_4810 [Richelia intracellularis HM01]
MNIKKMSTIYFITGVTITMISGCFSSKIYPQSDRDKTTKNNHIFPNKEKKPSISSVTGLQEKLLETSSKGKVVSATLYTSDPQCQKLIPKKVVISAEKPINAAIARIIRQQNSKDFSLSGYRTSMNNGTLTIDLRVAPKSKRQIISLSSCEQFALFSSLRKTLINNNWNIKKVDFKQLGQEIIL